MFCRASLLRGLLCLAFVCVAAATVYASRVASAGSPKFSVECPSGWKSEVKTNQSNQQIMLGSSTRTVVIIGVEVTSGDPASAEAAALDWVKKNKFPKATVLSAPKAAQFGTHSGHEMTLRDKSSGNDYGVWLASFYEARVAFVCIGISPPDDLAAASADYRAVVATVQLGAATTAGGPTPNVSKPGLKDKLKNFAKAFKHILMKIPVFNPNSK